MSARKVSTYKRATVPYRACRECGGGAVITLGVLPNLAAEMRVEFGSEVGWGCTFADTNRECVQNA